MHRHHTTRRIAEILPGRQSGGPEEGRYHSHRFRAPVVLRLPGRLRQTLFARAPTLIGSRLRLGELPYARRISGETGLGAILFHLSTSLYNEAEDLNPDEGTAAIESYLRILAACVGKSKNMVRGLSRLSELAARITHYIDVHLAETALSPAEIASAMDISVRHVHRVFSHQGLTVADWIRAERLRRCRDDLSDPWLQSKKHYGDRIFLGL